MEIILQLILNTFVMVYVDDIIIFSKNLNEHITHLKQVFTLLQKAGMKIKVQKCRFARQEVEYLGHIVSYQGIKADPKKLTAVQNFPTSRNLDELRSLIIPRPRQLLQRIYQPIRFNSPCPSTAYKKAK
jgi:hypothetical protein